MDCFFHHKVRHRQLAYNGQVRCVQTSDENLMFQHYQMICHTSCIGIVCFALVYFGLGVKVKRQFPALLLIIRRQNMVVQRPFQQSVLKLKASIQKPDTLAWSYYRDRITTNPRIQKIISNKLKRRILIENQVGLISLL